MKKTILPVKKEVSFGHSSVKSTLAAAKGSAKDLALGTNKPKMPNASVRTVKGQSVIKAYKTSTLGK